MPGPWAPASAAPRLAAGEVHVWWADLDLRARVPDEARDVVRGDMGDEAPAAAGAEPAGERGAARATLHGVLAAYLQVEASEVRLAVAPGGKPHLADPRADLHFSVSHSGRHGVFAVGRQELGVDLELVRPRPRLEAVVRRFLDAAEAARIDALPDAERERALLGAWVRREAAVKCLGVGLAGAGDEGVDRDVGRLWTMSLPPMPGAPSEGALAAVTPAAEVRYLSWPAPSRR